MEKACRIKCHCYIELIDDEISMRWSGTFKKGKHGEKEKFGMERILSRFEEPYIEMVLEDVSHALNLFFKENGA